MLRRIFVAVSLCVGVSSAIAHDVITTKLTYTRDISRIFAKRCVACHASGASIPLTSYQEVRPWAVDIKQQVLSRQMPPWGAVKGFGTLSPDDGLTQEELLIVSAWVLGGAPEGDPKLLPAATTTSSTAHSEASSAGGIRIVSDATLRQTMAVTGIKPMVDGEIASSRITAQLPDGRIEPLLWLFHYDGQWKRTFSFSHPIALPSGTVIRASSPVTFELQAAR